jgi:hypothetical protein
VRLRCATGCALVRVRVYISPLTARQLGVRKPDGSRYTAEVLVARAPTFHELVGRRTVQVQFRAAVRRRLAVANQLRIAIEGAATDAAGVTRTVTKRLTLRR